MELKTYAEINTLLNIHQSIELNDIRKTSRKQLEVLIANNKELQLINNEMRLANETNKRILENQIREIRNREEQKYYKSLSYNMSEIIDQLSRIQDKVVQYYFVERNFDKIINTLVDSIDVLEEIADKQFNKNLIQSISAMKSASEQYQSNYQTSLLSNVNKYIEELSSMEKDISSKKKTYYYEPMIFDKPKINKLRLRGLISTGVLSLLFVITGKTKTLLDFEVLLIFIIPFVVLLFFDIKWRRGYANYLTEQNNKRALNNSKKQDIDDKYLEEIEKLKVQFNNSTSYKSMEQIHTQCPEFNITLNQLTDIDRQFNKKWNIRPEKTGFTLILKDGGKRKFRVIGAVKEIKKVEFKEASNLVLHTPNILFEGITKNEAEYFKMILEKAGASIEMQ